MEKLISLGQVIKSRGLKGEIKIKPWTADLKQFLNFREVFIGTTLFSVLGASISGDFIYLKLDGIESLEAAEKLKGKDVCIERKNLKNAKKEEYFLADLIGCKFKSGEYKGLVIDVHQYGAADVIEVKLDGGGKLLFPHLMKLGLRIDIEGKIIEADSDKLKSVAVIN
ncbi:MAG: ribosome maturation factor RimM [Firmicutes bacterium]|nr:ribosome maturation factor RimM [Bacillota bacterium]